jgi:hypothetical protein
MQDKEPFILELAHVTDHEDGGATYSFDCSKDAQKRLTEIGLQFVLYCGVAEMDIQDVYNWILAHKIGNEDRQE